MTTTQTTESVANSSPADLSFALCDRCAGRHDPAGTPDHDHCLLHTFTDPTTGTRALGHQAPCACDCREGRLFDSPVDVNALTQATTAIAELSADRRRTLRNRELLAAGIHPLLKLPLKGGPETCGDCAHRFDRMGQAVDRTGKARTYIKCDRSVSNGPATDIRASWPACTLFEARP